MHRFVIRYASCNVGSVRAQHHEAPNTACTEAGSHRFAGRTEHSSSIAGENASYTYALGHFGLLTATAILQADLIR